LGKFSEAVCIEAVHDKVLFRLSICLRRLGD
jgi:hypothetical protein